jgi:hypothetical protein
MYRAFIHTTCPAHQILRILIMFRPPSANDFTTLHIRNFLSAIISSSCHSSTFPRERGSRGSSVGIATGYGLKGRVRFLAGLTDFLYSTAFRPALRPTQLPVQMVLGALSPGAQRRVREANYSPPTSAEVKNAGAVPPLLYTSLWSDV